MTRKWYVGVPVVLMALSVATAASAEPLRTANVGDQMESLVTGLQKANGGSLGSCAAGAPVVSYVNYVVPGRPADDDNASFQALTIGDRVIAVVAYDEQDLSTPVAVYADIDGKGLITNMWQVADAPEPCDIMQGLHYQP
jgi:hypothetical protein